MRTNIIQNMQSLTIKIVLITALLLAGLLAVNPGQAEASDMPVEYPSGTLTSNQTWTNDKVWFLYDMVTVPDGVTLTIQPGTIVKMFYTTGIQVNQGGTLDANGSSSQKIVFTSFRDDSVGGDSDYSGPSGGANGDYNGAVSVSGGVANVGYIGFAGSFSG